jgi:hypothetical protein
MRKSCLPIMAPNMMGPGMKARRLTSTRPNPWANDLSSGATHLKVQHSANKSYSSVMVGAHPRTPCRSIFKKSEISLPVLCQCILLVMNFFVNNHNFQTNLSVHSVNTKNNHHLQRPVAKVACFEKRAFCCGARSLNSLPCNPTNLKNEKTQFKVALKILKYTLLLLCKWIFYVYRWLILTIRLHKMFMIFLHCKILYILYIFMTYSTFYCLVTNFWIHGMYVLCMLRFCILCSV